MLVHNAHILISLSQVFPDGGLSALAYFVALLIFTRQARLSRTAFGITRVSRWTFLVNATIDAVCFAGHITFAILAEGRASLALMATAFLSCILFIQEAVSIGHFGHNGDLLFSAICRFDFSGSRIRVAACTTPPASNPNGWPHGGKSNFDYYTYPSAEWWSTLLFLPVLPTSRANWSTGKTLSVDDFINIGLSLTGICRDYVVPVFDSLSSSYTFAGIVDALCFCDIHTHLVTTNLAVSEEGKDQWVDTRICVRNDNLPLSWCIMWVSIYTEPFSL